MAHMATVNPFETDGEFGFRRDVMIENHGKDAMVHLALGQCDIPEALPTILDHHPNFRSWLARTGREAFAVTDDSVGLYFQEDESPMKGTGCIVISKPKS